jgi:hypothetical protein
VTGVRFPSFAIAAGLVSAAALVVSCGDLFHDTNWESLCDHDASAAGCNNGGGKTTSSHSSSHASTGSGGTAASGGGGMGGGPDPCNHYCNEVVDGCMVSAPQYPSKMNCNNVCEAIPHQNDPNTDDIPCREDFASQVATNPLLCEAAGPGAADMCGPLCDAYCGLMTVRCSSVFPGVKECADACKLYDKTEPYTINVVSGNNFACRLAFAVKAFDDTMNCVDAGPMSTACVDGDM